MPGDFLICTPEGREQVKRHGRRWADTRDSAQLETKRLLAGGRIDQAADVVNRYWKSVDRSATANYDDRIKKEINRVMNIKKVRGLTEAEIEDARLNAVMELLWNGEIKCANYSPVPAYQIFGRAATRSLVRKQSQDQLRELKNTEFISGVEIICCDDACPICKAVAEKSLSARQSPDDPNRRLQE